MSEHYRHAVDMAEVEWQAWWNAGTFHLDRSGNLELADQYLRKALEAAPEEQSVWYTLAKLNRRCNRPGEERQWLERLASGNCRDVVVFNRLTTLRLDAGDLDGACAAAESTLRIDPDNYPALCSLGRVHRRQGRPELAVEQFSRAAETYTAGAEAWIQLGEVCLDMKEANQAGIFFERALSLEPQSIPVLLGLLETTLLGGDFVKAVTWSDRAMKALDIRQSRMIDTFEDFALILLDILFALQDKPERSRVRRVLALLPLNRGSMSCYVRDIQGINEERKAFFIQEIGGLQGEARSA
jgi:tetratricopeptide (TPR) repeat protein